MVEEVPAINIMWACMWLSMGPFDSITIRQELDQIGVRSTFEHNSFMAYYKYLTTDNYLSPSENFLNPKMYNLKFNYLTKGVIATGPSLEEYFNCNSRVGKFKGERETPYCGFPISENNINHGVNIQLETFLTIYLPDRLSYIKNTRNSLCLMTRDPDHGFYQYMDNQGHMYILDLGRTGARTLYGVSDKENLKRLYKNSSYQNISGNLKRMHGVTRKGGMDQLGWHILHLDPEGSLTIYLSETLEEDYSYRKANTLDDLFTEPSYDLFSYVFVMYCALCVYNGEGVVFDFLSNLDTEACGVIFDRAFSLVLTGDSDFEFDPLSENLENKCMHDSIEYSRDSSGSVHDLIKKVSTKISIEWTLP